jgi:hypothetical protein
LRLELVGSYRQSQCNLCGQYVFTYAFWIGVFKIGWTPAGDGFHHKIVIRTLSGFCYLCQQLAYLVLRRIFMIASQIGELLGSYQKYLAKWASKGRVIHYSGKGKKLAVFCIKN